MRMNRNYGGYGGSTPANQTRRRIPVRGGGTANRPTGGGGAGVAGGPGRRGTRATPAVPPSPGGGGGFGGGPGRTNPNRGGY